MPQDEIDAVFFAKIRDPVPAVHAFNAYHQVVAERFKEIQQGLGLGFDFRVEPHFAGLINDADIQATGVQVDSTVVTVGAIVEIHESSPL